MNLTSKLPNKPILPWSHFDSPWLDDEVGRREETEDDEKVDVPDDSVNTESEQNHSHSPSQFNHQPTAKQPQNP